MTSHILKISLNPLPRHAFLILGLMCRRHIILDPLPFKTYTSYMDNTLIIKLVSILFFISKVSKLLNRDIVTKVQSKSLIWLYLIFFQEKWKSLKTWHDNWHTNNINRERMLQQKLFKFWLKFCWLILSNL